MSETQERMILTFMEQAEIINQMPIGEAVEFEFGPSYCWMKAPFHPTAMDILHKIRETRPAAAIRSPEQYAENANLGRKIYNNLDTIMGSLQQQLLNEIEQHGDWLEIEPVAGAQTCALSLVRQGKARMMMDLNSGLITHLAIREANDPAVTIH